MKNQQSIGIFDSGVGGLTVFKEVIKCMPNENIIYFGDIARVPYGDKSKDTIFKFSCQIINFLKEKNVKAIIIACNSVSSNCYEQLVENFKNIPIIEVVGAGVDNAINTTKNQKIGVIGTKATIKSNQYTAKIKQKLPKAQVFSKACPLFVPIVEEGWFDNNITEQIVDVYLSKFIQYNIDTLILGCTHYPFLQKIISKKLGNNIKIVNPAVETAKKMKQFLHINNLLNLSTNAPKYEFFASDFNPKFDFICSTLLNKNFKLNKINIEKY